MNESLPQIADRGTPGGSGSTFRAVGHDRRLRALRSGKFVEQLRASTVDIPELGDPQHVSVGPARSSIEPRDDAGVYPALHYRVTLLRAMAGPRLALPDRIAARRWTRIPFVKRLILKYINYSNGPVRQQATLIADCVDLISDELRRARGFWRY